jgi:denticleless
MYDAIRLGPPLSRFTHPNYRCSSFYVRMNISPDSRFLVSGSSDKRVYIWEIDAPGEKPVILKGHESEVSSVSWCKTDLGLVRNSYSFDLS